MSLNKLIGRSNRNPLSDSNSVKTQATYNDYGMPLTTTDANNVVTQITYGNITCPSGTVANLYPTLTVAAYGTAIARTSSATYDCYTGLVLTTTDEDNDVTNAMEYDDLGRPVKSITAQGTALESWTQTTYHDPEPEPNGDKRTYVVVRSDLETKDDKKKVATQFFDQLGRVRLSKTLEDSSTQSATNETDGIKVQTRYLSTYSSPNGYTYQLTSNPYRASVSTSETDVTMGWTRSKAWHTGKKSEVETFSGAGLPAPWGSNSTSTGKVTTDIDANATTVTDQAGKLRRSITNALGQLIRVDEPNSSNVLGDVDTPNQATSYAYDTLNNLTTVTQGSQTRTFAYSSLSRLTSAINPESGTIAYEYDNNGNLTEKTDARSVVTTYTYDALNRVTDREYSDSTPDVEYFYGTSAPKIGKLTKVQSSVSTTEYTSFDILGRVTGHKQTTDANEYATGYSYNLAGALIDQTYPSGRVVKNVLDGNGDLETVRSKKNANYGFFDYAKNFTYNAGGGVTSIQLGNGRWESTVFNSRLQPTQIALGTTGIGTLAYDLLKLNYGYGTTTNNGNVLSQTITVPGLTQPFVQNYTYDSLNRLSSAIETNNATQTWKQTFTFDRYGNRRFDFTSGNTTTPESSCSEAICNPTISTTNNRINATGYSFDTAGNTTADAHGRTIVYDAENKQIKVNEGSTVIGEYFYDGDGKRVKKYVPGTGEVTIFVYDAAGKVIQEHSTIVASAENAKVGYLTNDHVGSPRINTDANGAITSRHDYHPFGEEIATAQRISALGYVSDDIRKQFATYERDQETNLDFAQSRYMNFGFGRYSTPDSFTNDTHVSDPQSWNLYTYVRNNPFKFIDPFGKKAEFEWYTDRDGVIHVKIKASFAIYSGKGQNVSKKDLETYKTALMDGIKKHLTKNFNIEGRAFNVTTDVSAKVYGSEEKAAKSGRGNLVELGYGDLETDSDSEYGVNGVGFHVKGENFDRMVATVTPNGADYRGLYDAMGEATNTLVHEFAAHLTGAGHNIYEPDSLFSDDGGKGGFFKDDFTRMFTGYDPGAGPSPGRALESPYKGINLNKGRRYDEAHDRNNASPSAVFRWVKRVAN